MIAKAIIALAQKHTNRMLQSRIKKTLWAQSVSLQTHTSRKQANVLWVICGSISLPPPPPPLSPQKPTSTTRFNKSIHLNRIFKNSLTIILTLQWSFDSSWQQHKRLSKSRPRPYWLWHCHDFGKVRAMQSL